MPAIDEKRDRLVRALRERGVDYLAPSDAAGEPLADDVLIASLAAQVDPRLQQALIALFLLKPELAGLVPELLKALTPEAGVELKAHYMAAVYLQQMWWFQLERSLPPFTTMPDYFSQPLGLPAPQDGYGRFGLAALADWHGRHASDAANHVNHLSEYESVAQLLLERLRLRTRRHDVAPTR